MHITNNATSLVDALFSSNTNATISNVKFVGDSKCIGIFAGGESAVPGLDPAFPDEGVVLGAGNIENLPFQDSGYETTHFVTPGDQDLNNLLGQNSTADACVLQVDFECNNGQAADVFFNCVFGSDEDSSYEDLISSLFYNDIFGLFLNGDNLAIVPNTTNTPVTTSTVNQNQNSEYFIVNKGAQIASYPGIEMDGFTQKFTTVIGSATNGKNTLKIAIADVGDSGTDSWVLLEAGSITCKVSPQSSESSEYHGNVDDKKIDVKKIDDDKKIDDKKIDDEKKIDDKKINDEIGRNPNPNTSTINRSKKSNKKTLRY